MNRIRGQGFFVRLFTFDHSRFYMKPMKNMKKRRGNQIKESSQAFFTVCFILKLHFVIEEVREGRSI